jgi:VWFA-related protein
LPSLSRFATLSACLVLAWSFNRALPAQIPSGQGEPRPDRVPQLIPRTHDEREARYLTQHRIILNVSVSDASGKPFTELKESDFTLIDNHQPRKLLSVQSVGDAAKKNETHVILVFDTVNSSSRKLRSFVKEFERYLGREKVPLVYPLSIGIFSGSDIDVGQPSRDREALLDAIRQRAGDLHSTGCLESESPAETSVTPPGMAGAGSVRSPSMGTLACKNQRFTSSVSALDRLAQQQVQIPGRVILIWMGAGWPLLTDRQFTPDTQQLKESFFYQLVRVSTALKEAQITLDAVASPDDSPNPESLATHDVAFFEGVSSPDQARAGNLGLHALTHQSGGQIFPNTSDIPAQIRACIADADSYYVLTFDSPPAAQFGEYHALEVKVLKPELIVRASTLYYTEP